ncbi:MAG: hypothetical protein WA323_16370 [Candidatus Nitrosopolaris sp.]
MSDKLAFLNNIVGEMESKLILKVILQKRSGNGNSAFLFSLHL